MGGSEAEVLRIREVLGNLIELSGLSRREIEKRLQEDTGAATDLGRLLSGRLDLKVRHLLDICRVIDVYPQELFRIVFKESGQRSPLLQKLDTLTTAHRSAATPRTPTDARTTATEIAEMRRLLSELLRRLEAFSPTPRGPGRPGPPPGSE